LEHPTCFDNYAQTLHFHADNSAEPTHIFDRDDEEGCLYNEPVFKYDDVDNELQYSLFFDANQWVIEANQNVSNYRIKRRQFVCKEEDLYECTAGKWFEEVDVEDVSVPDDYVVDDSASNSSLAVPLNTLVMLLAMKDAEIKTFSPKDGGDSGDGVAVVIVCIAVGILVLVASGYLVYRCRNKQKMKMNAKQMEIPDEEEEEEDEVEDVDDVEVTVPIRTDI
jgi:hypothetical protein